MKWRRWRGVLVHWRKLRDIDWPGAMYSATNAGAVYTKQSQCHARNDWHWRGVLAHWRKLCDPGWLLSDILRH